jgi:structure-specific endonuclease subunit SLX1
MSWNCYCLCSTDSKKTYVGATLDPDRRLKQHNGILSGGAKATRGNTWRRVYLVGGFPDQTAALQFEWMWKHISREVSGTPIERRKKALAKLMSSEKSTSSSVPFASYPTPLLLLEEIEVI